jgi:nucleoside diphosphate kinase
MKQALSYVMVTPYTVAKSRTGGVIARLLSRSDLELVGAQLIAPDEEFTRNYAALIRRQSATENHGSREDLKKRQKGIELLANYIEQNMAPSEGRRHRSLLLLFRGEDPCAKLCAVCGALYPENRSVESITGETIRDTYADLISSPDGTVSYFEPAVMTPRRQSQADENMAFFAGFLRGEKNIISNAVYPDPSRIEQTLVIIKPDNWQYASSRPGTIIDMFSRTGLRIVGLKVHRFSLAEAMEFYGPVEAALGEKLAPVFGKKARECLEKEFALSLDGGIERALTESFGKKYALDQFERILEFMSGRRPGVCPPEERGKPGPVKCMILIYEGENAVRKIRDVLGPTDPLKAPAGTVRRDFGSNVMINTAHASDSAESFTRETAIVRTNENSLGAVIGEYLEARGGL